MISIRALAVVASLMCLETGLRAADLLTVDDLKAYYGAAFTVTPDPKPADPVKNAGGKLAGVFTHGDFVRAFQKDAAIADKPVREFMTANPIRISASKLAAEVLATLEHARVDDIVVVNDAGEPVGLVDTQDLTRMKLV